MEPAQALEVVTNVTGGVQLNRADHQIVAEALNVLSKLVYPESSESGVQEAEESKAARAAKKAAPKA